MDNSQGSSFAGVVYTETVVWAAPEAHAASAPYQLAIVQLGNGSRLTARIVGDRASVGDRIVLVERRNGTAFFRKMDSPEP
jgi:uncharacterized OB-fold protein